MAFNMNIARAAFAAAALAAGSQAFAAEPFSGPYVGVQGGWQQDKVRATVRDSESTTTGRETSSGFAYGAQLGYDFKVGESFVVGAEAFLTGDTDKLRWAVGPGQSVSFDGGRSFGLLARAGVLATPKTLIYAKGGWENGRFTLASTDAGVTERASTNRDGWSLGAGVEQMLTDNVSARVEYRYTKFNSFGNDDLSDGASARVNRNRIMAGVNYRF